MLSSMANLKMNLKPISMAIMIMISSLPSAYLIMKKTNTSWLSFMIVLTFSSGMMILFTHTSSFVPNEKSKTTKKTTITKLMPLGLFLPFYPAMTFNPGKISMKTFSNLTLMIGMTLTLILTMVAITSNSHNPNQSISSTF